MNIFYFILLMAGLAMMSSDATLEVGVGLTVLGGVALLFGTADTKRR